ncbi:MAG: hypothetical protein ACXWEY_11390 [Bacteroidia bacterium]
MKKFILFAFASLILCGLFSFKKLHYTYNNIFTRLGLQTEEAESYITVNITGGSTTFPTTRIMAKLALDKRAEAVKEIGDYIKTYVQKPQFAKEYSTTRAELKPEHPPALYQGPEDMAAYKQDLKRWEADYPTTVNGLLKKKLKEFLVLTADINFNAKLEKRGDKMVFSDPALEAQDEFWKACFRSGKPTVDAARAYAQQWLQEIK